LVIDVSLDLGNFVYAVLGLDLEEDIKLQCKEEVEEEGVCTYRISG